MYRLCLVIASTLLASNAMATTSLWSAGSGSLQGGDGNGNGNYLSLSNNGIGLTISGWSDTGWGWGSGDDDVIRNARLAFYGDNLGMINRDEDGTQPEHSADNISGDYDTFLLEFDQSVNLTQLNIGWATELNSGSHADISVAAYQGSGNASLDGYKWSDIAAQGWTSVGNYADVDDYNYQSISTNVNSKYWLISAYNPIFGTGSGLSDGNDGFKLLSVSGTQPPRKPPSTEVPEPGMFALFMLGLVSLVRSRKKIS